tara:strand:+ start:461 stop:721 length:261 start_codon:yes stop_codon:yes gene_type:complete
MKWTKEQLIDISLLLVKIKSKIADIDNKYFNKFERMTFGERMDYKKIYRPLRKKIDEMEKEILLNVAGNGVEGEPDDSEPPPKNKE